VIDIEVQPKPDTVYAVGDTARIWVSDNSTTHQWYKIGSGALSGKTDDTLKFAAQLSDSGRYYCLVNGVSTDTVHLTVLDYLILNLKKINIYMGLK
jgi:hypothetical protein